MKRFLFAGVIVLAMFVSRGDQVFADARPIQQLPADVMRWSTLWIAIPGSMAQVAQEHGPLAAVTWGPAKGTMAFVQSTAKEVWDPARLDKDSGRRFEDERPNEIAFRYTF